jgi:peptide/nickel transport system substrate-binding protein
MRKKHDPSTPVPSPARARRRRGGLAGVAAALAAWSLSLSACSGPVADEPQPAKGGVATWAEPPGAAPNYIFPINSCCYSVSNVQDFQYLMYRPLYWFGNGAQPTLDPALSLAGTPVYSDGDTVVTVNLRRNYMWSDGEHVDAQDVLFFLNLLRTVKDVDWGAYTPGYFPDNVVSVAATGTYQVTLQLQGEVNPEWFTDNELSQVTPLPLAWDVDADGAVAGSGGCAAQSFDSIVTTSTRAQALTPVSQSAKVCYAVYSYLAAQAADPGNYAFSPVWGVVDGPWRLKSLDPSTGDTIFVPNGGYTGPQKPALSEFEELGFGTSTDEYQALESGSVDVGYLPLADAPPNSGSPLSAGPNAPALKGRYQLDPLYYFQVNYLPLNYFNPEVGAVFAQQYVRAALQMTIDQEAYIKQFDGGYGVPTYGPVPVEPPTYASPTELHDPYPYNPTKAAQLLTSHGWTGVGPGSVATCSDPGTGPGQCGSDISGGAQLAFTLLWAAGGDPGFHGQVQAMESAWAQIGVQVTLQSASFQSVTATAGVNCLITSDCAWEAADWGGGWVYSPDYFPTGEGNFDGSPDCATAAELAASNAGGYCDATNHADILATIRSGSPPALYTYEDYLAEQLPVLYQPLPASSLTEVRSHLSGVLPQNVFGAITPENWSFQQSYGSSGSRSPDNGVAHQSGRQIVTSALAALRSASSVQVSVSGAINGSPVTYEGTAYSNGDFNGTLTTSGVTFQLVKVGGTDYINSDETFWTTFGSVPAAEAAQLAGKWVSVPDSRMHVGGELSIGSLADQLASNFETVSKVRTGTMDGQAAVEVTAPNKTTLWVATTGPAYPISGQGFGGYGGRGFQFGEWNQGGSAPSPPAGAIAGPSGTGPTGTTGSAGPGTTGATGTAGG